MARHDPTESEASCGQACAPAGDELGHTAVGEEHELLDELVGLPSGVRAAPAEETSAEAYQWTKMRGIQRSAARGKGKKGAAGAGAPGGVAVVVEAEVHLGVVEAQRAAFEAALAQVLCRVEIRTRGRVRIVKLHMLSPQHSLVSESTSNEKDLRRLFTHNNNEHLRQRVQQHNVLAHVFPRESARELLLRRVRRPRLPASVRVDHELRGAVVQLAARLDDGLAHPLAHDGAVRRQLPPTGGRATRYVFVKSSVQPYTEKTRRRAG